MGNCQNPSSVSTNANAHRPKIPDQLAFKANIWQRESHGLFDYEGKNCTTTNFKLPQNGTRLFRGTNNTLTDIENTNAEQEELLKLTIHNGIYWMNPNKKPVSKPADGNSETNDNTIWLVVKSLHQTPQPRAYRIKQGDIVKMGRIRYRIRDFKVSGAITSPPTTGGGTAGGPAGKKPTPKPGPTPNVLQPPPSPGGDENASNRSMTSCRICLMDAPEPDNPFVQPCLCAGTMRYVHVKCLQSWLKSRFQTKNTTKATTTITWKTLECELCKKSYPSSITVDGNRYDTIDYPKPETDSYIVLEILSKEAGNMIKGLHIVNTAGKSMIKMGRGHESDLRVSDISVSRTHAIIQSDKNGYSLLDNSSKFGTLVMVRRSFPINSSLSNMQIQINRTLLTVTMPVHPMSVHHFPGSQHGQQATQTNNHTNCLPCSQPQETPKTVIEGIDINGHYAIPGTGTHGHAANTNHVIIAGEPEEFELRADEEHEEMVNSREEAAPPPPAPAPQPININEFFYNNQFDAVLPPDLLEPAESYRNSPQNQQQQQPQQSEANEDLAGIVGAQQIQLQQYSEILHGGNPPDDGRSDRNYEANYSPAIPMNVVHSHSNLGPGQASGQVREVSGRQEDVEDAIS